jgi:nitroimidazol reductase NimA-like FMN-containing flavoprotein (pyridoxamine 5'-phosphate oxidase superfamily)
MIEIQEMTQAAVDELLENIRYGHLGCARNNQPYIVPIYYSYRQPYVYIYTTDGKKSEMIRANPWVCLQVEDVVNDGDWRSVVIIGEAERLEAADREEAMNIILADNPGLTPAVSLRWRDNWMRENIEVIYRIKPKMVTGRYAIRVETRSAVSCGANPRPQLY